MRQIDNDLAINDLLDTMAALDRGSRDFIQKEYNNFLLMNATLAYNAGVYAKTDEEFTSKVEEKGHILKYSKKSVNDFIRTVAENQETLMSIGRHFNRFSNKIRFRNIPFLDACRSFSEKECEDIILSYYATYGDKYYKIVKKYFDENRVNLGSIINKDGLAGYYLYFLWLESGFVYSKYSKHNSHTASLLAHEFGHVIDAETFLFPQQKKIPIFSDIFLEIPSIAYEVGFYDYLKSQNIDLNGGMILRNNRAASMLFGFYRIKNALSHEDLLIYENGVAVDNDKNTYNLRKDLIYGLGYDFGFHLSEIRKSSTKEYLRVLNNLMTLRKEMTLDDAIKMTGFNYNDFVNGRYIKEEIKQDCLTLKKRYNIL